MNTTTIKPNFDFRAGNKLSVFRIGLMHDISTQQDMDFILDLSEVDYMDTASFRLVFDLMPSLKSIIPPKIHKCIEDYNDWLDGKKGLKK